MTEKIDNDFRQTIEFILSAKKVYSESDLLKKDHITFFAMLEEAKQVVEEEIARAKAQQQDGGHI